MKRIEIPTTKNNANLEQLITIDETSNKSIFNHVPIKDLYYKYTNQIPFTKEDLISLYDIYNVRYRLKTNEEWAMLHTMKISRIIEYDMATIFDCSPEEVTDNVWNLRRNPSRYVVFLNSLNEYDNNHFRYPNLKYISGCCSFERIRSIENVFPSLVAIGGYANFNDLNDSTGLENLISIGGMADFGHLVESNGLSNLEIIGASANFNSLKDACGLSKLKYIYGDAYFNSLTTSNGLDNLIYINGQANFKSLTDASHLSNLEFVAGDASFTRLTNSQGLENLFVAGSCNFEMLRPREVEDIKRRVRKHMWSF